MNSLLCFAYLNCAGTADDKLAVLYTLFLDERQQQNYTACVKPTIDKLIKLCTVELAQLIEEVDGHNPMTQSMETSQGHESSGSPIRKLEELFEDFNS